MRILSRAIFREVFAGATLGTLLFVFVLFLRTIERLSVLLVRVAAPPAVIGRLLLYALPATVPFALPLGVLARILVGLSRMSADNEIVALRRPGAAGRRRRGRGSSRRWCFERHDCPAGLPVFLFRVWIDGACVAPTRSV